MLTNRRGGREKDDDANEEDEELEVLEDWWNIEGEEEMHMPEKKVVIEEQNLQQDPDALCDEDTEGEEMMPGMIDTSSSIGLGRNATDALIKKVVSRRPWA